MQEYLQIYACHGSRYQDSFFSTVSAESSKKKETRQYGRCAGFAWQFFRNREAWQFESTSAVRVSTLSCSSSGQQGKKSAFRYQDMRPTTASDRQRHRDNFLVKVDLPLASFLGTAPWITLILAALTGMDFEVVKALFVVSLPAAILVGLCS